MTQSSTPESRYLWPIASRAGDVIFVYSGEKPSLWTRVVQSLARWGRPTRYSHVALGHGPGVLFHADGKKTTFKAVCDELPLHPDPKRVRVARLVNPELTSLECAALIAHAELHTDQPYTPFYGRRSPVWRLLWRLFDNGDTNPYCSELVAKSYASIGVVLSRRSQDRVLPHDLDRACTGPRWLDVTDAYYPPLGSISAEQALNMDEICRLNAAMALQRYQSYASLQKYLEWKRKDTGSVSLAYAMAIDITPILSDAAATALILDRLNAYYLSLHNLSDALRPRMTETLQAVFEGRDEKQALFENRPTLAALARDESDEALLELHSVTTQLLALLLAVATGCGLLPPGEGGPPSFELAAPVVKQMPSLDPGMAQALLLSLEKTQWPEDSMEASIAKGGQQILKLHYLLITSPVRNKSVEA